jgi:hypothetical protein
MDMQWPSLVMARPDLSVSLENMTLVAKQQRAADGVDYGVANFGVGLVSVRDVTVGDKDAKKLMRFEGITARSETSRRGNNVEIAYRSTVNAMVMGDERVDHANFAFRLTNVPVKVMADFSRSMREQNAQKLDPKAQQELMLKNMKDLGKRALQSGAVLLIDDISAGYRGNVAAIKGRVSFAKTVDADFQDIKAIMKKIVAHFEVRVPVALIRDVGRAISARSVDASAADAARQIDAGADAMVSFVVGKAVSSGFAVVEKDELRSTIDIKDDKLSINGKSMELPKNLGIKAAPEAKPAPAPKPSRILELSCAAYRSQSSPALAGDVAAIPAACVRVGHVRGCWNRGRRRPSRNPILPWPVPAASPAAAPRSSALAIAALISLNAASPLSTNRTRPLRCFPVPADTGQPRRRCAHSTRCCGPGRRGARCRCCAPA